jgi:hypothetical protein
LAAAAGLEVTMDWSDLQRSATGCAAIVGSGTIGDEDPGVDRCPGLGHGLGDPGIPSHDLGLPAFERSDQAARGEYQRSSTRWSAGKMSAGFGVGVGVASLVCASGSGVVRGAGSRSHERRRWRQFARLCRSAGSRRLGLGPTRLRERSVRECENHLCRVEARRRCESEKIGADAKREPKTAGRPNVNGHRGLL